MKLTPTLMVLAIGAMTANSAHAEKYCKTVDRSGNASYTLAPETGCNKKKSKTIGVRTFTAVPVSPTTSAPITEQKKSTSEASSTPSVTPPTPTKTNTPEEKPGV